MSLKNHLMFTLRYDFTLFAYGLTSHCFVRYYVTSHCLHIVWRQIVCILCDITLFHIVRRHIVCILCDVTLFVYCVTSHCLLLITILTHITCTLIWKVYWLTAPFWSIVVVNCCSHLRLVLFSLSYKLVSRLV